MKINILAVPNEQIKLREGFTGADWWWDEQHVLQIRLASELPDKEQAALAVHEMFEALLCLFAGVTVQQVDEFDKTQQDNELHGLNAGDEPNAPYRVEHTFATAAERIFTGALGLDWKAYDERLSKL